MDENGNQDSPPPSPNTNDDQYPPAPPEPPDANEDRATPRLGSPEPPDANDDRATPSLQLRSPSPMYLKHSTDLPIGDPDPNLQVISFLETLPRTGRYLQTGDPNPKNRPIGFGSPIGNPQVPILKS